MKYLKLYESFKYEFNEDLKSIRDNYKNQLEKIKAEIKQSVDEYILLFYQFLYALSFYI